MANYSTSSKRLPIPVTNLVADLNAHDAVVSIVDASKSLTTSMQKDY